ncbi:MULTISPECIES: GNAT family N-acetyltransferase [Methanocalculus]|uniref:GNAT family N-acetyltransferase n=1 Tax=Methanocalculus TaxID=71151 RepID=UPI0020A05424|nr:MULTISPECIES: GNAT family N-acetyltransferase [unclassified Methanocalculus]MCP1662201.1 ribosomal protein S18 acetylase RimI-like enzyme [Methanocalculus sp. AMF5]
MECSIRPYIPDDYPHICRIDYELFGDFGYSPIFLRQAGELFTPVYFVAAIGEERIGFIIGAQEMETVREGWILRIGVTAAWQGRGIGAALMNPLLQSFQDMGVERVRIALSKRHGPVTDLLLSTGFSILAYEKAYYYPDIDRLIMERLL